MSIRRIESNTRMSQAVVYGGLVALAGQVAVDAPGRSVTDQTRNILERVEALLAEAGTDKSKIITANIWLSDISTFDDMNAVWDAWVAPGHAPARATVEARLAAPEFRVEIAVTAAVANSV
jgi:enamine deaminase RidA (YjgF/YER057c/UK114 family)